MFFGWEGDQRHWVADVPGHKHLHSAASSPLIIPDTRRSSIDDRAFVVTAVAAWNKLPQHIRSATSLPVYRRQLTTHLLVGPRGSAVERQSLASVLSLSCTPPVADG